MRFFFLCLSLAASTLLFAQDPEKAIEKLQTGYPQEKVVLLFSKPAYLAGETLYFSAYALTGYEASDISGNLYTELYDRNKNLLDKQIIPLYKGAGNGSYNLPSNLAEDVYYLRAYTSWMLNFDPAFQCIKPFRLYNPYSMQSLRPKPVQWSVNAVAESGLLLAGVSANIGVRLTAAGSLPASWKGTLVHTGTNTAVEEVTVYNNEIGQVRFVPEEDAAYKIVVTGADGTVKEVALPMVKTKGVMMQVMPEKQRLRYGLLFKDIASAGIGYKLLGVMNQQIAFTATIARSDGQIGGLLDIGHLPAGILQLILFDEKGTPVTERLCFLHQNNLQTTTPVVTTDTLSLAPKGYNHWQLAADSASWTTYTVTVSDAALPQEDDFLSAVYLGSDFTTPIANPAWYFDTVTATKTAALDALLLTEKWHRFQWSEVLNNRFPPVTFAPDRLLSFSGTVVKSKKMQPLREMNLLVQAPDSSIGFVQVKTDSSGRFFLKNFLFTDSLKVYYQPSKQKFLEGEVGIRLEPLNKFYPFTGNLPQTSWTTGSRSRQDSLPLAVRRAVDQRAADLLLTEKSKVLEAVRVTAKARNLTEELDNQLSSSLFAGGDATVFDFVNENQIAAQAYANILEWLQGRVPGYVASAQNGVLEPTIRGSSASIFLDEMRVEADVLSSISIADIALIKVFRNNFVGSIGGGSAIAIYTRRGNMPTANNTPSLPTTVLYGYRKLLPYPSLDYSADANRSTNDQRIVLFHGSFLQPANKTKIPIVFYNNDVSRQYRLRVSGFDSNGTLVYLEQWTP